MITTKLVTSPPSDSRSWSTWLLLTNSPFIEMISKSRYSRWNQYCGYLIARSNWISSHWGDLKKEGRCEMSFSGVWPYPKHFNFGTDIHWQIRHQLLKLEVLFIQVFQHACLSPHILYAVDIRSGVQTPVSGQLHFSIHPAHASAWSISSLVKPICKARIKQRQLTPQPFGSRVPWQMECPYKSWTTPTLLILKGILINKN